MKTTYTPNASATSKDIPTAAWSGMLKQLNASTSAHFDVVRAVAAAAVMWGHLRGLFFVDFGELTHDKLVHKIAYFLTGFGHEAVMVFFVLSGFLISSSILRSQASETWSFTEYAINRGTRLYVVLIPGLIFGTLWDRMGSSLFASSSIYSSALANFGGLVVQHELTIRNFFGNLLFLQTIACPTYGSNAPLWSIAYEFWYYVLFPVGLLAIQAWIRKKKSIQALFLAILALCIGWILGPEKMIGFLIWLGGFVLVLTSDRPHLRSIFGQKALLLGTSVILVMLLIAARTQKLGPLSSDLVVGLGFVAFLFAVLRAEFFQVMPTGVYSRSAHLFAGFSYSLYVLHFPFLLFLRAWLVPVQRWYPDARHLVYGVAIGVATLAFSWFISTFTELRTGQARKVVRELFGVGSEKSIT